MLDFEEVLPVAMYHLLAVVLRGWIVLLRLLLRLLFRLRLWLGLLTEGGGSWLSHFSHDGEMVSLHLSHGTAV